MDRTTKLKNAIKEKEAELTRLRVELGLIADSGSEMDEDALRREIVGKAYKYADGAKEYYYYITRLSLISKAGESATLSVDCVKVETHRNSANKGAAACSVSYHTGAAFSATDGGRKLEQMYCGYELSEIGYDEFLEKLKGEMEWIGEMAKPLGAARRKEGAEESNEGDGERSVEERVKAIICDNLDCWEDYDGGKDLVYEFDADSLDVLSIIQAVSSEFGIKLGVFEDNLEDLRTGDDIVKFVVEEKKDDQ